MNTFIIPLVSIPQQFQLVLAGITYLVTCKWNNSPDAGWCLDFDNPNTNESIVHNIPLITGADLLQGLGYLGLGVSLFVYTDTDTFAVPTFTNLGTDSNLYFQVVNQNG